MTAISMEKTSVAEFASSTSYSVTRYDTPLRLGKKKSRQVNNADSNLGTCFVGYFDNKSINFQTG